MDGLMQDWPLRLHRILDHAAIQHGTRAVVSRVADGSLGRTTYAALRARSLKIAARLAADGIAPGDRVATLAWNGADHMAVWYGAAGIGAVYHTINPRLFPDQIAWIIRHAADRVLVTEAAFLPLLAAIAPALAKVERILVLPPGPGEAPPDGLSCIAFEDWLEEPSVPMAWRAVQETDAAGLCYTSATTGDPKGVLYSHRSTVLHAMLASQPDILALSATDTIMPIVPMFHVNAWGIPFVAPMVGATLVLPGGRLDPESLCALFEGEGVTISAGVPTVWLALLDHLRRRGRGLPALKRLFVGGTACPRSLIEAFDAEFGIEVCQAWGMTEISPIGSAPGLRPPVHAMDRPTRMAAKAAQGSAPFGIEMKLEGDDGPVPWDGTSAGRLFVRGFAVASAYYGEGASPLDRDGFFDTGDIATIDPAGLMRIVDRSKDIIKSGGEWISSVAIETLAMSHPGVAEAAVIGIADRKWSERPLLVVVGRPGATPTREALLAFLAPHLTRWALPAEVRFVEALPHTAVGKVSKRMLRDQFAALVQPPP